MYGELYMTMFLWGLGALLILLIGLLTIDGYLFYFVRTHADVTKHVQNPPTALSPREMDEVIDMLDRREQEFNEFLMSP